MNAITRGLCLLGLVLVVTGCEWSDGGSGRSPARAAKPAAACVPASWACGEVAKLDARSGAPVWQVAANGDVNSVVPDRHGGAFVAGGFTRVAGVRRPYVAHILASGQLDRRWQPRVWSRSPVRYTQPTLALAGGRLFAAGLATSPKRPAGIVAINAGTGVLDRQWGAGIRVVGGVAVLAVSGHHLYVGGTLVRGQTVTGSVAALDVTTGVFDPAFHSPIINGGEGTGINALAVAGGRLYLGGQFASIDGVRRNGLAVVDSRSGRLIRSWHPRLSRCGECVQASLVYGIVVDRRGVHVATAALRVDGARRFGVALADAATGAVLPWAPRLDGNALVVVVAGGRVYIGGDFTRVDETPWRGLAAIDPRAGHLLPSWQPGSATSAVLSLSASKTSVFAGTVVPVSGG